MKKTFSNGVTYSDLDNDGDLDLVINNINAPAFIYQNQNPANHHFLRIKLKGSKYNPMALGSKVEVFQKNNYQMIEHTLSRGFQSSVEPLIHFGLGNDPSVNEIKVHWPDGHIQIIKNPKANQVLEVAYNPELFTPNPPLSSLPQAFEKLTLIKFAHQEDNFNDFENEPLLPHKNSQIGPCLTSGDINQDGLEDIFIGNAKGAKAGLFIQNASGKFELFSGPWEKDSIYEDTGCILEDLDLDGDLDLYVVSGGNDPKSNKKYYQDRLYINDKGQFKKVNTLPQVNQSGKTILPLDFDQDGDLDLFIGGRIIPGKYPFPPQSLILENLGGKNQQLKFKMLDQEKLGELNKIGLVTAAQWGDLDNDDQAELILTGEWMNIEVFKYQNSSFTKLTSKLGLANTTGWWRSLKLMDIDKDGDLDLIAGNLGLNYKYKASKEHPFMIYASDFDENGRSDIVLSYEKKGKKLPLRGRQCSSEQIPMIAKRFKTYESFADATLEEIYGEQMLEQALHYKAHTFAHTWFENKAGKFIAHQLPALSQISSIEAILPINYNEDEYPDFILAGNLYPAEVETPRNDASVGLVLLGAENGKFKALPPHQSGLKVKGEVKAIQAISRKNESNYLVFGLNNQPLETWKIKNYINK